MGLNRIMPGSKTCIFMFLLQSGYSELECKFDIVKLYLYTTQPIYMNHLSSFFLTQRIIFLYVLYLHTLATLISHTQFSVRANLNLLFSLHPRGIIFVYFVLALNYFLLNTISAVKYF